MPTLTTAHPRFRMAVLAGSAALGLGVLVAAPAYAHDSLIASSPEADEILSESPEEVVLEFSGAGLTTGEGITNDIVLLDAQEQEWSAEDPAEVEGSVMRTDIPEPLPNGEYQVHYRVVYSDGHSEELSYGFEVEAVEEDQDDEPLEVETGEPGLEESATEPTPEEEELLPDDEAGSGDPADAQNDDDHDDGSGGVGGILLWTGLAAAVLALAGGVGYAAKRRRGGGDSAQT